MSNEAVLNDVEINRGQIMNTSERLSKALKQFKFLEEKGIDPVIARYGEADIAYPCNEDEYCRLGGYAVLMVVAISEYPGELPIERAYFQVGEKVLACAELNVCFDREPLRDRVKEKKDQSGRTCFENISFWVLPVLYFKIDAGFIAIDFKGERKKFTVHRGPWKLDGRVEEYLNKHIAEQIKLAEHVPYEMLAHFVEREFFQNNRVEV